MDDSVTELQIQVAYLRQHVHELDDVVRELYDRMAELTSEVRELRTNQNAELIGKGLSLEDEKPPHY